MPGVAINGFAELGIHAVEQQQAGADRRAFMRRLESHTAPVDRFNDGFLPQRVAYAMVAEPGGSFHNLIGLDP